MTTEEKYKMKIQAAKEIRLDIENFSSLSMEEVIDIINNRIRFYEGFLK